MFLEKVRVFAGGSNPTPSVGLLYFQLSTFFGVAGFSYFLRVPRDFQKLRACPCAAPPALLFASRNPNRVAFRVALSR